MIRDYLRALLSNCRGPPFALLLAGSLLLAAIAPVAADHPSPDDPDDVSSFVKETMNDHLESHDLAGAVISLVKDGEIVYAGGHGYADVDQQILADESDTLFRIGSVTKLFTWTAAMQLVEDGQLDLDQDVNTYLPEPIIDDGYDQPVTMSNLMSHSSGLDDRFVGIFARDAADLQPLDEVLYDDLPPRVREPGEYSSYSNFAVGLAGYVVEQVSGMSWEDYVEENIIEPLEMDRTTPRQPVPDEIDATMAIGYEDAMGELEERGFEYLDVAPAGSISSTAIDMSRFMLAQLNQGELDGARILEEESAEQLHTQHFTHDPDLGGWAHGFMERHYNERRYIGHDGATLVFVSNLWLDLEEDLGLFLAYNTRDGGGDSGLEFIQDFVDRYYPQERETDPEPANGSQDRIAEISGNYRPVQLPENNLDKVMGLMGVLSIEAEDERTIRADPLGESPFYFEEVAPYEFRETGGDHAMGTLVFRENPGSGDFDLFIENMPESAYEPVAWYETPEFNLGVVGASMLIFFSAIVAWPIGAFRRRHLEPDESIPARIAGPVAGAASLLLILFLVVVAVALSGDPMELAFGVPTLAEIGLGFALVAAILSVPALALAVIGWVRGHWSTLGRIHLTLVSIALLAMVWWLYFWNLLGFQY